MSVTSRWRSNSARAYCRVSNFVEGSEMRDVPRRMVLYSASALPLCMNCEGQYWVACGGGSLTWSRLRVFVRSRLLGAAVE